VQTQKRADDRSAFDSTLAGLQCRTFERVYWRLISVRGGRVNIREVADKGDALLVTVNDNGINACSAVNALTRGIF
jgi:hypothetical protein